MALFAMSYLRSLVGRLHLDERAQDTFEYVLVLGTVVVLVLAAVVTPVGDTMIDAVLNATCGAINGIDGADGIDMTCAF